MDLEIHNLKNDVDLLKLIKTWKNNSETNGKLYI